MSRCSKWYNLYLDIISLTLYMTSLCNHAIMFPFMAHIIFSGFRDKKVVQEEATLKCKHDTYWCDCMLKLVFPVAAFTYKKYNHGINKYKESMILRMRHLINTLFSQPVYIHLKQTCLRHYTDRLMHLRLKASKTGILMIPSVHCGYKPGFKWTRSWPKEKYCAGTFKTTVLYFISYLFRHENWSISLF